MRYLKKSDSFTMPRNFLFWDTETTQDENGNHHLRFIAWTYGGRLKADEVTEKLEVMVSATTNGFFKSILNARYLRGPLWCFCHNLGFDSRVINLVEAARRYGIEIQPEKSWKNQFSTCLFFRMGNKPVIFLDSVNLYGKVRLRQIGERLDFPKLKTPTEHCSIATWKRYAKQDVRLLAKAVFDYLDCIEKYRCGGFRYTVAGQAWERLKFRHNNGRNVRGFVWHNNPTVKELEKKAYHGGRCEAFRTGTFENCTTLDVVSLYGFCMANFDAPGRLVRYAEAGDRLTVGTLAKALKHWYAVADVTLEVPRELFIPPYPVRTEKGTMYPTGTFRTQLSTHSLRHALKHGHLKQVHKAALYEKTTVLRHYSTMLLEDMRGATTNHRAILKLILNSITGRFARKRIETESTGYPYDGDVIYDEENQRVGTVASIGKENFVTWKYEDPHEWSFHAVAAHITDAGRMWMLRYYQKHQQELVYTDTDSLILRACYDWHTKEPGKLKTETRWNEVQVFREKYYRGKTISGELKRVCTGIPKNAEVLGEHKYRVETWDVSLRNLGELKPPTTKQVVKKVDSQPAKRQEHGDMFGTKKTYPHHMTNTGENK